MLENFTLSFTLSLRVFTTLAIDALETAVPILSTATLTVHFFRKNDCEITCGEDEESHVHKMRKGKKKNLSLKHVGEQLSPMA